MATKTKGDKKELYLKDLKLPKVHFDILCLPTLVFPVVSLVLCLFFAMYLHYEDVTRTHCRNWEFWPSISSTIGNNAPEKYIWRYGIGLYSMPKCAVEVCQFIILKLIHQNKRKTYTEGEKSSDSFSFWNAVALITGIAENLLLYALTMVSSTEDRPVHENSFILFMLFAHMHFVAFLIVYRKARYPLNSEERTWFKYRVAFALSHFLILVSAVFVYVRHKKYCEPGMYSIFAMMEWSIVVFNILFHTMAIPEFRNMFITLGERESSKKE
eukprot:TRINITY_DN1264_c0_g1_i1.p1 TRINITY_DN1264_c0_g1~~TRINITY_DN1264_c0_g1_i1.p1  ORF type:complete len:270 (+),score=75.74 TRINITY_DN1264_c0_g1_i1:66-875(+)